MEDDVLFGYRLMCWPRSQYVPVKDERVIGVVSEKLGENYKGVCVYI